MQMAFDGVAPDGGSAEPPVPRPQPEPQPPAPEPDSMDEFLDTVKQIEEREQWMRDMKKLGKLEYESESRVKVEIAERVARMKVSAATVGLGCVTIADSDG